MKKFKVTFIKPEKLLHNNPGPVKLAEQIYWTDLDELLIIPPVGYAIMQVVELLPEVNQCKNTKDIVKHN